MKKKLILGLAAAMVLASCGGSNTPATTSSESSSAGSQESTSQAASSADSSVNPELSSDDADESASYDDSSAGQSTEGSAEQSTEPEATDWSDEFKAIMQAHLYGEVLPFFTVKNLDIAYSRMYDTVFMEGGRLGEGKLDEIAEVFFDDEGWEGDDVSVDYGYDAGTIYSFLKAVDTPEGTRYINAFLYGYDSVNQDFDAYGNFRLEAYDPYFYAFPSGAAELIASEYSTDSNPSELPAIEADYYDYSLDYSAIICTLDSQLPDAGYSDILEDAGWDVGGLVEDAYYTAVSPDGDYEVYYMYDSGALLIFLTYHFDELDFEGAWDDDALQLMAENLYGEELPYLGYDFDIEWNDEYEELEITGGFLSQSDLLEIALSLYADGWEVDDISSYYGYADYTIFSFSNTFETEDGDRYISGVAYLTDGNSILNYGSLAMYFFDPFYYEFPEEVAASYASAVADPNAEDVAALPALEADHYEAVADQALPGISCYIDLEDGESDDCGYIAILEEAGWVVDEDLYLDQFYYAESPDGSYAVAFFYDEDYSCLDIYFLPITDELDFEGAWDADDLAEIANIDGVVIPYVGFDADVEYDDYYGDVAVTGGWLDINDLAEIADAFEDDGWTGGDMSAYYDLDAGHIYSYTKWVDTAEGQRLVSAMFYLGQEADYVGSLTMYISDPFYYEWPEDAFNYFIYNTVSSGTTSYELPPEFEADYYEINSNYLFVSCYTEGDGSDDAGYGEILEDAGWTILEERDSYGYYVAVSPDESYQLSYLYNAAYGSLDIYVESYAGGGSIDAQAYDHWDNAAVNGIFNYYGLTNFGVPAFEAEEATYYFVEDEYNILYYYYGLETYMNASAYIIGATDDEYDAYIAGLAAAGWEVEEIFDWENRTYAGAYCEFVLGNEVYTIQVAYSDSYIVVNFYLLPSVMPHESDTFPSDYICSNLGLTAPSFPTIDGASEYLSAFYDEDGDIYGEVYCYFDTEAEAEAAATNYEGALIDAGFELGNTQYYGATYYAPSGDYAVAVEWDTDDEGNAYVVVYFDNVVDGQI